MKMQKLVTLCGLAAVLSFSSTTLFAKDDSSALSPAQKKQFESVIHDYLVNNPQVLVEVSQKLQQQQEQQMKSMEEKAQQTIPKLAKDLFSASGSPVLGNAKGNVTIVEFFDYQCPHCKDMETVIDGLVAKDKNIRVVFKEFPIFGNSSVYASKAALAANNQGKYKQFHKALMDSSNPLTQDKVMAAAKKVGLDMKKLKADMDSAAVQQELDTNLKLAQDLGLLGTPAFVVGDTTKASSPSSQSFFIPGAFTQEMMVTVVEQVRKGSKS